MARLPQPGGDSGNWGVILNDYLSQAHDSGGALKSGIAQSKIQNLSSDLAIKANAADVVYKDELVLNVKDYGAIGDGVTNDTSAINAAFAALPTDGGTVYFSSGNYLITGSGVAVTGKSDWAITASNATLTFNSASASTNGTIKALTVTGCNRFRIEGLVLNIVNQAQQQTGISISTSSEGIIRNNKVSNSRWCGITVFDTPANTSHDIEISNNIVEYCRFEIFSNGQYMRIINNHIADYWLSSTEAGLGAWQASSLYYDGIILGSGAKDYVISGNIIVEAGQSGIYTGPNCSQIIISGNEITSCQNIGIDLDRSIGTVVTGNYSKNCAQGQIHHYSGDDSVITGNVMTISSSAIDKCGVLLNADCTNITIVGNTINIQSPTTWGIFINSGAPKSTGCLVAMNTVVAPNQYNLNTTDNRIIDIGQNVQWGNTTVGTLTTAGLTKIDLSTLSGFNGRNALQLIPSGDNTYAQITADSPVRLYTSGGVGQALTAGDITGLGGSFSGLVFLSDTATLRLPRASTNNTGYLYYDATDNALVFRDSAAQRRMAWGGAAPVVGSWARGDRMMNSNASIGSPQGWVCTAGGSPGTWVALANL